VVEYCISADDDTARRQCDNTTEYACANGRTCIALKLVNNTVNDCEDNSDEGKFNRHTHTLGKLSLLSLRDTSVEYCLAGVKVGCVHLCRVASNTV